MDKDIFRQIQEKLLAIETQYADYCMQFPSFKFAHSDIHRESGHWNWGCTITKSTKALKLESDDSKHMRDLLEQCRYYSSLHVSVSTDGTVLFWINEQKFEQMRYHLFLTRGIAFINCAVASMIEQVASIESKKPKNRFRAMFQHFSWNRPPAKRPGYTIQT
jgi:hypothetical protein